MSMNRQIECPRSATRIDKQGEDIAKKNIRFPWIHNRRAGHLTFQVSDALNEPSRSAIMTCLARNVVVARRVQSMQEATLGSCRVVDRLRISLDFES